MDKLALIAQIQGMTGIGIGLIVYYRSLRNWGQR